LQGKFLHARLIRRDGGAFDADPALFDRLGGIERHPVGGGVTVLDGQVIGTQVDFQIGENQLFFDEFPDDAGHLVAIEFDDGIFDGDAAHDDSCWW